MRVIGMSGSAYRYGPAPGRNVALRAEIVALAQRHRRYGSTMIYLKLRQSGHRVNRNRVERLYAEEKLQVRPASARRYRYRIASRWGDRRRPTKFGRWILCLTDDATHEAVAIVSEREIGGLALTRILDRVALRRGFPQPIQTDNGKEFCGRAMLNWAHERSLKPFLIEPCKPDQNAGIESFNLGFSDERLSEHWFTSLLHAKVMIKAWRREYNDERPKKSLGGLTPSSHARKLAERESH